MVNSIMNTEHPDEQATEPADKPFGEFPIPRWVVFGTALLVMVPLLIMSSMMLMMSFFGLPMYAGMAAEGTGIAAVVGVIPLLVTLSVLYGMYRLYAAEKP